MTAPDSSFEAPRRKRGDADNPLDRTSPVVSPLRRIALSVRRRMNLGKSCSNWPPVFVTGNTARHHLSKCRPRRTDRARLPRQPPGSRAHTERFWRRSHSKAAVEDSTDPTPNRRTLHSPRRPSLSTTRMSSWSMPLWPSIAPSISVTRTGPEPSSNRRFRSATKSPDEDDPVTTAVSLPRPFHHEPRQPFQRRQRGGRREDLELDARGRRV